MVRNSLLGFLLSLAATTGHAALTIGQVEPSATSIIPAPDARLLIRFNLSEPAIVAVEIYDGRDLLIRKVQSKGALSSGENSMSWDLKDAANRVVPAEAYQYVLVATSSAGENVRYDLSDTTGGERLTARDVKWNAKDGLVTYVLDQPARVSVRMGLNEGGPLLRTLIDWVVRPAGSYQEAWDGKDASRVLDLANHPRLVVDVQAFTLPRNAVLVGPPPKEVTLIKIGSWGRHERVNAGTPAKRMYDHSQQSLEQRGDFSVVLQLPANVRRSSQGVPIIKTKTPLRLDIDQKDRERALARRFEPVFFVDGQFAFENEVGFVPMTWNFDPATVNPGEHFLTVNLRGYEGNFGMATVKILVER